MKDDFTIRWPRWQGCIGCIGGAALLYVLLDIHFFHHLAATSFARHSFLVNLFLGTLGMWILFGGAMILFRPPTILRATPSGLTIHRPKFCRRDRICLIPWDKVTAVEKGTMYRIAHEDSGRFVRQSSALLITCDPAIGLEDFGHGDEVSVGAGPASPGEVAMWPGSRIAGHEGESQMSINARYVPASLDEAIRRLLDLKRKYS